MDKYEYRIKAEQIRKLAEQEDFASAVKIADTIDWNRVRSIPMLCLVGEIYEKNNMLEESRDVMLIAYDRHPYGRMIIYSLAELSIRLEDYIDAVEYYKEFVQVAPRDTGRYILQYKLYEAQHVGIQERIAVLEEFKKHEYIEKWAFELAYLYHRAGMKEKCIAECDEMMVWFSEGKYVEKAMELKMLYEPLSEEQQKKYENRNDMEIEKSIADVEAVLEKDSKESEIQIKPLNYGIYDTVNLQNELARSMEKILNVAGKEVGSSTEKSIQEQSEIIDEPKENGEEENNLRDTVVMQEAASLLNKITGVAEKGDTTKVVPSKEIVEAIEAVHEEVNQEQADLEENGKEQITSAVSEKDILTKQLTSQLSIEEVLQEWERIKKEAAKKDEVAEKVSFEEDRGADLEVDGNLETEVQEIPFEEPNIALEEIAADEISGEDGYYDDDVVKALEVIKAQSEDETEELFAALDQMLEPADIFYNEEDREKIEEQRRIREEEILQAEAEEIDEELYENLRGVTGANRYEKRKEESLSEEIYAALKEIKEGQNVAEKTELEESDIEVEENQEPELEEAEIREEVEEAEEPELEEAEIEIEVEENQEPELEFETPEEEIEEAEEPELEEAEIQEENEEIEEPELEESETHEEVEEIEEPELEESETQEENEEAEEPELEESETQEEIEEIEEPELEEFETREEVEEIEEPELEESETQEEVEESELEKSEIEEEEAALNDEIYAALNQLKEFEDVEDDLDEAALNDEIYAALNQLQDNLKEKEEMDEPDDSYERELYGDDESQDSEKTDCIEDDLKEDADLSLGEEKEQKEIENFQDLEDAIMRAAQAALQSMEKNEEDSQNEEVVSEENQTGIKDEYEYWSQGYTDKGELDEDMEEEAEFENIFMDEERGPEYETVELEEAEDYQEEEEAEDYQEEEEVEDYQEEEEVEDYQEEEEVEDYQEEEEVEDYQEEEEVEDYQEEEKIQDAVGEITSEIQNSLPEGIGDIAGEDKEDNEPFVLEENAESFKKLFKYFTEIDGVSEQILDAIDKIEEISDQGNVIIMGDAATGKTTLAVDIIKAAKRSKNITGNKVARITGEAMNSKPMQEVIDNSVGGVLIVEEAASMTADTVRKFSAALENTEGKLLVILEDSRERMMLLLEMDNRFREKFPAIIDLPPYTNTDLVAFAHSYATEMGCTIDEMGVLALYSKLAEMQYQSEVIPTLYHVKELINEAMEKAKKRKKSKSSLSSFFSRKKEKTNETVIQEKDFI